MMAARPPKKEVLRKAWRILKDRPFIYFTFDEMAELEEEDEEFGEYFDTVMHALGFEQTAPLYDCAPYWWLPARLKVAEMNHLHEIAEFLEYLMEKAEEAKEKLRQYLDAGDEEEEEKVEVSREALRFLVQRSLGEVQMRILSLLERYTVLTPTILVEEGVFKHARARAVALASQALRAMERLGLLRHVARGHYAPTELGLELAKLVKGVGG